MSNYISRAKSNIKIVSANGIYLYDEYDKVIIDCCSNSMNVNFGYSNYDLIKAATDQYEVLPFMHNGKADNKLAISLSERLSNIIGDGKIYDISLSSNGSDVIETALRISTLYCNKKLKKKIKFASFKGSYHGSSLGALSVTGHYKVTESYDSLIKETVFLPYDYDEFKINKMSYDLEDIDAYILDSFITNPIGCKRIDKNYLLELKEIAKENDSLIIMDEVAVSFGRLGDYFGFDKDSFFPDMICVSKGIGVGYANIGALYVKKEIINSININSILGHTFNANPVACAIANKVLDKIENDEIFKKIKIKGNYLRHSLNSLKKFSFVESICGEGMMYAIHLSNKINADKLNKKLLEKGLLLLSAKSSYSNHLTICPPFIIEEKQIDEIMKIINDVFNEEEFYG